MGKTWKGISVNVLLLGMVSFLNDVSSDMILPILPLFIVSLGGTGVVVGLIGGLQESISSILKVFSGYYSDRTGRRKIFVFSGYITSAIFKFLLSLATMWQHVLLFASMERIGKGIRTAPRDAIIADSMPERRGIGFGIHRMMDSAGAVLGSIIVFVLFWFLGMEFKTIILVASILAFLSLFPLTFVKEKKKRPKDLSLKISLTSLSPTLKIFLLIAGIFALANFSYMFFILQAKESFQGRISIAIPILLYILFNIFYTVFAIPFGELSDRVGRDKVLILGYSLFSLTALGFVLFHSLEMFIVLFILYGIFNAIVDSNQRAFVSDLSSGELRATALGTFHTTTGLLALPSSLIAGFLWQISPSATFIYGASFSFLAVVLFLSFRNRF